MRRPLLLCESKAQGFGGAEWEFGHPIQTSYDTSR